MDDELETFGTVGAWSKKLGVTETELLKRLDRAMAIQARDKQRNVLDAYPEFYIRELWPDLFDDE